MTGGLAALPMYDWAEVRPATDRFWAAVRDGLRRRGVAAPEALSRDVGLMEVWTDPALVLGQTCGLPLVRELRGRVALVGAADYGLEGCRPGWYRSAVVVRADDPRERLALRHAVALGDVERTQAAADLGGDADFGGLHVARGDEARWGGRAPAARSGEQGETEDRASACGRHDRDSLPAPPAPRLSSSERST